MFTSTHFCSYFIYMYSFFTSNKLVYKYWFKFYQFNNLNKKIKINLLVYKLLNYHKCEAIRMAFMRDSNLKKWF